MMTSVKYGFFSLTAITYLIALFKALMNSDNKDIPTKERAFKRAKQILVVALSMTVICSFIPDSKQLAAIYVIPVVANNESVKAMSSDAMEVVRLKFEEYLDSIRPEKVVGEVTDKVIDKTLGGKDG